MHKIPQSSWSINTILAQITSGLITIYQYTLSPDKGIFSRFLKGRVCAHEPHCSAYGKQCLKNYGFWPGIAYTTERVLSCKPSMHKIYDPARYRIVYFSGSPIGIPFLEQLHSDPRFEVVGVVTMTDKPIGRGHTVQENSIAITATQLGITEILKPTTLKPTNEDGEAVAAKLQSLQADYFVVVAYGKIMPQSILDIPTFGPINVHGSILPEYRGASPLQTVFLDDFKKTGLTIMLMNDKMDAGDMVATYEFALPFEWTSKELFEKVKTVGPGFLNDTLWELGKGHIQPKQQDEKLATYCVKIEKQDGYIDLFTTPLRDVYNKYRAYALWPKIWTTISVDTTLFPKLAGKTLIIESVICDVAIYNEHADQPVIILDHVDNQQINLSESHNKEARSATKPVLNPAITSLFLKPEGKKAMSWDDFMNGYGE